VIRLRRLGKSFDGGTTYAVRHVSLDVPSGETLVLLGSSGSGKSTTLKMINRLVEPTEGSVELDGVDVEDLDPVELRRSIGYVFQGIGLFPHMTVAENVAVVPRLSGWAARRRTERAHELLELVGLAPDAYAERFPAELSGGQRQRVGVARALAADPDHLLMDEPFGALDAVTRDHLQQEFSTLQRELKKTVVFVTHDILEALALGDRIAVLHEGRLEQVGPGEELVRNPATDFVHSLFDRPMRQLRGLSGITSP
jgi:osmoprotectant transport system ATP-binding protein